MSTCSPRARGTEREADSWSSLARKFSQISELQVPWETIFHRMRGWTIQRIHYMSSPDLPCMYIHMSIHKCKHVCTHKYRHIHIERKFWETLETLWNACRTLASTGKRRRVLEDGVSEVSQPPLAVPFPLIIGSITQLLPSDVETVWKLFPLFTFPEQYNALQQWYEARLQECALHPFTKGDYPSECNQ